MDQSRGNFMKANKLFVAMIIVIAFGGLALAQD